MADDLQFEELLTPEGAQIQQVTMAPSFFSLPGLGNLHFILKCLISYPEDQLEPAEGNGSMELTTGKVKGNSSDSPAMYPF